MKKIIAFLLVSIMALSLLTFVGCNPEAPEATTLKLGLGSVTSVSATDATATAAGTGAATTTIAAVLVDADGKIVKAVIDCADYTVSFNTDGTTAMNSKEFKTKREQGFDYGMVAYSNGEVTKEWFEQADIFAGLAVGKTAANVMELVAETAKGNADVIAAGCTIYVSDFAKALKKACENAVASNATANDTLKLGVVTSQEAVNATAPEAGYNKLSTTVVATAVNASGTVTAASSDCVEAKFTFNANGASTLSATSVQTKKELGFDYGMVAYSNGAVTKEWFEQAAAFDAACVGKDATGLQGLIDTTTGKGNADVQAAGCTIYVSDLVKAAVKAGS